jgi:hypothetical protein
VEERRERVAVRLGAQGGVGEHDDIAPRRPVELVREPVDQDAVAHLEGRHHGHRGDVEGLDQKGLDQQGQDERDDDEGRQLLQEAEGPPLGRLGRLGPLARLGLVPA